MDNLSLGILITVLLGLVTMAAMFAFAAACEKV
jgi:hypothetical protein